MEMYYEDSSLSTIITNIETGATLWKSHLVSDDCKRIAGVFSDSLQLAVITDSENSETKAKQLQESGFQTVSIASSQCGYELACRWFFAPCDTHIVREMPGKNIQIIDVANKAKTLSFDSKWPCTTVHWSPKYDVVAICTKAGSTIVSLATGEDSLQMSGAYVVAFSEDGTSLMTYVHNPAKIETSESTNEWTEVTTEPENMSDSNEWLFTCEWKTNSKISTGDGVEWNVATRSGSLLTSFQIPGDFVIKPNSYPVASVRKVCVNSRFFVVLYLLRSDEFSTGVALRVWDRETSVEIPQTRQTYLRGRFCNSSMRLERNLITLDGGIIIIAPAGLRYGSEKEICYDGEWIWRDNRKLIYVPHQYGDNNYYIRYSNKTLAIGRRHGGITVLRCV